MRLKLSAAVFAAVAAAGTAVVLSAPAATAIVCPPGTIPQTLHVAGRTVTVCVPGHHCDPGPCTPPATARPPAD